MKSGVDKKEFIEAYEASHAVEEYLINGWHVWPLLKMIAHMRYLPPTAPVASFRGRLAARFPWLKKSYRWLMYQNKHRVHEIQDAGHNDAHDARRDVVILTLSERRVWLDGALYEIYSDPLVEQLHKNGKSTLVWEQGEERGPRYSKSALVSQRMRAECNQLSLPDTDEPVWFADYQKFTDEIMGRPVLWNEVASLINVVSIRALVFEQWLRKTGARYLFVVCWYDPFVMAAIMAARRCEIKSIELQHGVSGPMVFPYTSWMRSPREGYEVIPDVFWRWGKESAEDIRRYSPAFSTRPVIVAGGNLWLNRFRRSIRSAYIHSSSAEQPSLHSTKTILVTLQLEVEPLLLDAIAASPSSWKWLIRFHPARENSKRTHEELLFKETGHPGIEIQKANNSLLYGLLCESDVHVTGYSACVTEALAFGVQSVIISKLGREMFSSLIEQGLVVSADTREKLIANIEHAQRINPDEIPAITNMFASDEDARHVLKSIVNRENSE